MIATPGQRVRLTTSVALVFLAFHFFADALGSDRGQDGVRVGAVVVALTLAADRILFGSRGHAAFRSLGGPAARGVLIAAAIAAALIAVVPAFAFWTGTGARWLPLPIAQALGLVMQAGVAEELLFRGYLFGRLRETRPFWSAALASMPAFVAAHLILFFTMPFAVALAAVLLAAIVSFPLARLYELGGRTIWAPALVHAVVQGTVKVVEFPAAAPTTFPIVWMAAAAVLPWLVFIVRRPPRGGPASRP